MRRTGMYALNRGDVVTARTEFEIFPDAADVTEPLFLDVVVQFRITVRGYDATHDDPAEGPEGEISDVMMRDQWSGVFYQAPPEIDAWAREPDRAATLFQQALDRA